MTTEGDNIRDSVGPKRDDGAGDNEPPSFAKSFVLAFPTDIEPRDARVMIFTGYFDESGTHAGSEVVSVAGYVSEPSRWVKFDKEWRSALAEFGIEFFHMSDFAHRRPPYDWSDDMRNSRLSRLIEITNRHSEFSIATLIVTSVFNQLFTPETQKFVGGPYGLAAVATFMEAGKRINEHYPDRWIAYVLESGARGAGQVLAHFQDTQRRTDYVRTQRQFSLRFEDKRRFTPLQAADILAYELYLHLPRQFGMINRPPRLPILRQLAIGQRIAWGVLDHETLANFAKVISVAQKRLSE